MIWIILYLAGGYLLGLVVAEGSKEREEQMLTMVFWPVFFAFAVVAHVREAHKRSKR